MINLEEISILKLEELMLQKKINLIDIREHYLYNRGTIKGAKNIPYSLLKRMPDKYLLKDEVYYFFCENGILSKELKEALNKRGYHIINVKEGFKDF